MNLLSQLRRLFSNRRSVIQTRRKTVRLPGKSLHPYWIVGRDLCMYRREDFSNVPRAKRRSALALKLRVWSPFERTGHHCVWSGSTAMVWFWDEDTIGVGRHGPDSQRAGVGVSDRARTRVLPETVFRAKKPDGLYLQTCGEGFELQNWRSDVLKDAFWLPHRPDEERLRWFLDRQGAETSTLQPNVSAVGAEMAPEPWSTSLTPGEWLEANERSLVTACLLVLSMAVVWQETRFWKIHHLKNTVTADLARMQDLLDPLLAARNDLLRLREANRALSAILREPSQAHLMVLLDSAIPNADARFQEWHYQQRELTIVVEDPALDPITYVRALEAEPLFNQVKAEPARGGNRIEITLRVGM